MIDQAYTDQAAVEGYLLETVPDALVPRLEEYISAIGLFIARYTGRQFVAEAAASARVFDGDATSEMLIDECIAVTLVERGNDNYGGTFTTISAGGASGYVLLPNNAAALSQPFRKILYRGGEWACGVQNNRITARWGYSATAPADIQFAATVFVAGIINAQQPNAGQVSSEKIGNYAVTYKTPAGLADYERALAILDQYKRYEL